MIFMTSTYTFKIEDTNYINALVMYLGHLEIENLTASGNSAHINLLLITSLEQFNVKGRKIDELPNILTFIKQQQLGNIELMLSTHYKSFSSLQRVLPKFEPQACPEDPKLQSVVGIFQEFINKVTTSVDTPAPQVPILLPLTREQAWVALTLTYKQVPFASAIDLPSGNSILILTKNANNLFVLTYGDPTIVSYRNIYFNMDEGFFTGCFYSDKSALHTIPKELTTAFTEWVDNNREGDIFALSENIKKLLQEISQYTPFMPDIADIVVDYAYARPVPILAKRIQKKKEALPVTQPAQKKQKVSPS